MSYQDDIPTYDQDDRDDYKWIFPADPAYPADPSCPADSFYSKIPKPKLPGLGITPKKLPRYQMRTLSGLDICPPKLHNDYDAETRMIVQETVCVHDYLYTPCTSETFDQGTQISKDLWIEFVRFTAILIRYCRSGDIPIFHPPEKVHDVWLKFLVESAHYSALCSRLGATTIPVRSGSTYADPKKCALGQLRYRELYYGLWPPSEEEPSPYAPKLDNGALLSIADI